MGQHQPYIPLETVIQDYLTESEQGQSKYFKVFHLAFRGMEQLGLDAFYKIKTLKLPVNDNLTVNLPADYLNWTKVGVLNSVGEIIPLYYNSKITTYADLSTDRVAKTQDDSLNDLANWNLSNWFNYWNGSAYMNIYGVPSGAPFVGNFKIDLDNGVIVLNPAFSYDYIMIEYVASPVEGQEYFVPVQFREAIVAWLWWKDKRASTLNRGQVGISRDLRSEFYNERRLAIARFKPTRIYEKYQASQEQTRMSLKT